MGFATCIQWIFCSYAKNKEAFYVLIWRKFKDIMFFVSCFGCAGSLLLCKVFLLLQSTHSRALRLQYLWHTSFVALWHVESSWTRDQTCVPCIGRWILSHWSIREVQRHTVTWRKQHWGMSIECCKFRYKEGRYILVFTCIYRKTISRIFLKELVRVIIYWRKVGTGWIQGQRWEREFWL